MASVEDLERRVVAREARVRATEVDTAAFNEKLSGILGSQDVVLGVLREHGLLLASHDERLESNDHHLASIDAKLAEHDGRFDRIDAKLGDHDGKLDLIVDWIQAHP